MTSLDFSAQWATGYDFPALSKGWVVKETTPDGRPLRHFVVVGG